MNRSLSIESQLSNKPLVSRSPLFSEQVLVVASIFLALFGILMIYSTTGVPSSERYGDAFVYVRKQLIAFGIGVVLLYICSQIPIERLKSLSWFALPLAIILLILPMIPGVSHQAGGAARWISLGGFQLQPGEFVKILFVLFIAGYFSRRQQRIKTFTGGILIPLFYVGIAFTLFLLQPDFGSAVIVFITCMAVALTSGVRIRHILAVTLPVLLLFSAIVFSSEYRMKRVLVFLDPSADTSGKGYQLNQSLIAVGSGEFSGVGLGESQQKLFFLPAAHTDFIFAVIAEELGFLGASSVVLLFLLLLFAGVRVMMRSIEDPFAFSMATGLTLLLTVPAFLNMGVVTGLLPTKGLVLPFVGYGGSSLMASLAVVGLLLSISSRHHHDLKKIKR